MSSVAAKPRLLALADRVQARAPAAVWTAAGVVALTVVSLLLRTRALDAAFWIDEGLSVGIGSYDLTDIPGVLRQDGSPPLYYMLLHLWMQAFGTGEDATHGLSVVFSVLCVPVAFWAGRTLWGIRAGWIAAVLAAINPFLTFYAQETRMYSLVALLGLTVSASFLHVFADRDRRYLPVFAASLALMIYTHNWALFLGMGTVVALAWLLRAAAAEDRRALVRDALIGYGAVALVYLPWVPTLLFQAKHTGAPWAERPSLDTLLAALGVLLGGATTGIAVLLVAGNGIAGVVRDASPRARRMIALLVLVLSAVALAWLASQVAPAFSNRYFAAFVGPTLLLAAAGLSFNGRFGLVCLVLVTLYWFDPRTAQLESKSNVRSVAASIQTLVTAGDLVISTHPEQLPLLAYYLPDGIRYGTSMGPVKDPRVMDWRDALDRLRAAKAGPTARAAVDTLRPGQELVLVQPIIRTARWGAPWTSLVRKRSVQWERRLDADDRVRREAVVPVFGYDRLPRGVRAIVYRRVR
ncbi:MAG TPA: glycosyltransferase family 39 protein [Solirubrobacteraceae bacterium]|jgi:F0F1-type ATP synthase membrane subunit c/vacuolar-type H+-ATPase subunit K